ncbi:flagellar type III secretion system pore protein FliP [Oscillospiraceae bacterium PP1C4]
MVNCSAQKRSLKKHVFMFLISFVVTIILIVCCFQMTAYAAPGITIDLASGDAAGGTMGPLELLLLLTIIAIAPSLLIMMTSFTRIVIVLSFLRSALGTQQSPPNQIIIGLALFLTLFIMSPVLQEINDQAYKPYKVGSITQEVAIEKAVKPLKTFMVKQTQAKDLDLFLSISNKDQNIEKIDRANLESLTNLGLEVLVPSFITSELKRAFTIGFLLFIPFLIIDMVVSSTLMSMGMVMLPPSMIALPFKLMLFVLVDGWGLLLSTLVRGFK